MEIKGKIIAVLPEVNGVAKSSGNPWKKREYVLETFDTYPRKVKFDLFGERADQYPLSLGEDVTVSYDIESREFNGRWYTDIRAWKVDKGASAAAAPQAAAAPFPAAPASFPSPAAPIDLPPSGGNDDLPF